MKKILVPVDFSECSNAALDYALELAELLGSEVEVLHAWQLPILAASSDVMISIPDGPHQTASDWVQRAAYQQMDRLMSSVSPRVPLSNHIASGRAEETIIAYAKEKGVDLIVMGTHGRSGLSHLLLGSVAERVVRLAPCPVVTVKRRGG